jgi:hypothetical protein
VEPASDRLAEEYDPRITAAGRFQIEYELVDVNPDHVRRVELWCTRDQGQTWSAYQNDTDRRSPVDVHLLDEGLYGFRLVVNSLDAPAPRIPQDGDPADVWILVDRTRPQARITSARFGEGTASGVLQIQWSASDDLLDECPVTLRFSEQPGGPWSTIAGDLPNSGRYDWRLDRLPPRYLYLQLEVRDRAGNTAIHELTRPVIGEGRTPQAHIRDVRPIPDRWPSG